DVPFFAIADADWLGGIDRNVPLARIARPDQATAAFRAAAPVLHLPLCRPAVPGRPDPANAPAILGSIERAVGFAMAGEVAAVVTSPIQKSSLYEAGFRHPGHTEWLAELTHAAGPPVMMLASPALRVVPVTVHLALARAIATLSAAAIVATARITAAALRGDFAIAEPRLAIAGLNPHAGEAGAMGEEDSRIIAPAVAQLRSEGIGARGPLPPDTMFSPRARKGYDAAICMYHDQALIPLKTLDMDGGVNVTLNLPIVRTSPDHGTALDIAGRNMADPGSVIAAIWMAAEISEARARRNR
ncbi:MAG: 4-hydroxythreonine-4-phosphate dehydrogenase PdxA, partial [Acetobacteraceae bacterium]|nr:4-hydroxythreonine-4-phosphate dehydrogenase PdxA [Acetobacteraceae bacterium]